MSEADAIRTLEREVLRVGGSFDRLGSGDAFRIRYKRHRDLVVIESPVFSSKEFPRWLARNVYNVMHTNPPILLIPSDDPYAVQIGGVRADPYLIVHAYGITDMAIAQAIKKLLRCGRKHKTKAQDVAEAITSLQRWQELNP